MKIDRTKIDANDALPRPRLFQAPDGVLDLQNLNPPNSNIENDPGDPVVVSVLAPYGGAGEVVVSFGEKSQIFKITDPKWVVQDVCFRRDQLPAPGQTYDVYYEYGGHRSPPVEVTLINSGSEVITVPRHACSLFGTYAAGLVDAWVVPWSRDLMKADPVIRSVAGGNPSEGTSVQILWQSGLEKANPVGEIVYRQDAWEINIDRDVLPLRRLDILAFRVSSGDAFLNFSINI